MSQTANNSLRIVKVANGYLIGDAPNVCETEINDVFVFNSFQKAINHIADSFGEKKI